MASRAVGSLLLLPEVKLTARLTFAYAAHTFAFASATCWLVYVGAGGGSYFGSGRSQAPTATPIATNAIPSETSPIHRDG
ncbi:hypothetical protein [Mycobacterium asiaticum]|uniref:Uncharacterized protein n=1 Tax=Mycobacterium asiaticum TaxID=1790 RepID=A0A1A3CTV1_MYCAS|nr:hypothetical protein [Mycobacterium asiaticum]OBI90249.1 hypothetical protein A9X01_12175 [Mycobacterium asiaticum]